MSQEKKVSLLLNRDYLLLWTGQSISALGSSISRIVFPLLILDLTHSPAQAGFIGSFTVIPYVILSLIAGAFIDRFNRKKVMIICDIGRAIAVGSIFIALFFHHLSIVQLYAVALIEGIFFVFFDIAEISSITQVVGKEQVAGATAQGSATDGIAALAGPSIGATLYQVVGKSIPFLVDSISYVLSVFSLLAIKTEFQEDHKNKKTNIKKELIEGVSWLFHNKTVRVMAILNAGVSFVFADLFLILIVLAKEQKATPLQIGSILSIAAIGSIVGSFVGTSIKRRFPAGHIIIIFNWVLILLWLCYYFAANFIIIGIITAAISFLNSVWALVQISYRLSLTPDELQGRVNSVFRFIIYSILPVGMALTGILLQTFGAKFTIFIFSFILIFFAALATFNKELQNTGKI